MMGTSRGLVETESMKLHGLRRRLSLPLITGLFLMLVLGLLVGMSTAAAITLAQLQQAEPDFDWDDLEAGEVVTKDLPEDELDKAEVVAVVGVKVNATLDEVLDHLEQGQPGAQDILLDAQSDQSVRQSLNAFRIRPDARISIEWFYDPVADGTINLSLEELHTLQAAALASRDSGEDHQQRLASMEAAIRDVLAARINEYRHGGLAAVTPYDLDGEKIHPGDYLANSMKSMKLMRDEEPEFYKAFAQYPQAQMDGVAQRFFATVEENPELGGQVTSLKHWMLYRTDEYAVIAERKYYVSVSLDAMNTLIVLIPDGEECYVIMVNLTFTQKVAGFGGFIAHKVGRSKVKQNIVPLLEGLKAKYP